MIVFGQGEAGVFSAWLSLGDVSGMASFHRCLYGQYFGFPVLCTSVFALFYSK